MTGITNKVLFDVVLDTFNDFKSDPYHLVFKKQFRGLLCRDPLRPSVERWSSPAIGTSTRFFLRTSKVT